MSIPSRLFSLTGQPRWAWLLAFLLGVLAVAGFAPWELFPLPVLALAGLFWLARGASPRRAFGLGYAYGLGLFGAGVSWVYVSLHDFGQMPAALAAFATLAFCAFLALFPASALALAWRLAPAGAWRWLAAAPAAWLLWEWLRGWIFTGFPWLALGYSQVPASPLAGFAPLFGVYGVSGLVALSAGALLMRGRSGLALFSALWLVGLGLKEVAWTQPVGEPVTVSLLQGNIAQDLKFREDRLADTLLGYRRMVLESRSQLIVLPETALPLFLDAVPGFYLQDLAEHARQNGGDVLVGVPEREPDGRYYNSVVSFGRAPTQAYRKQHLVPFGEFVPPGFRWVVDYLHIPLSDFSPGARVQAPLAVAGQRVAVNICYEDAFGEEVIRALPAATLLVNVSNDAWFGRSFSPWQHLQMAQMRALETGRPMLRANNTGITALIDARGRVQAQLPPFVQGSLDGEVRGHMGLTPYARWGNGPAVALALVALGLGLRRGRA